MQVPAAGEIAAHFPCLWPDALSLLSLTQPRSPLLWPIVRRDPAALLLLFAHRFPSITPPIDGARLNAPSVLKTALGWLDNNQGIWIDWRRPLVLPVLKTALAIAQYARSIAQLHGVCDAEAAWTAGMLKPLGWFAVAAFDPNLIAFCLADPDFIPHSKQTERRHWGADHANIAAEISRRQKFPHWLASAICGYNEWSSGTPDAQLAATIHLAAMMAEEAGYKLGLADHAEQARSMAKLKLSVSDLRGIQDDIAGITAGEPFEFEHSDPRLDRDLRIRLQFETSQRKPLPFVAFAERRRLEERLQQAKLEALAEFAAGASHEINNPLAVIAGHSQHMLKRTSDVGQRKSLESILRQTQRIHSILAELMQFARPPRIVSQRLSLTEVLEKAIEQLHGHADEAGVEIECREPDEMIWVDGDTKQIQTAIACLIRNAIEAAAPSNGWVRIGIGVNRGLAEVTVEDNGAGLTAAQREHMFDPFYSGRSAGRGRGLGLSTAWRLAREHGGDVRFVTQSRGPTRFVLTLPAVEPGTHREVRKIA